MRQNEPDEDVDEIELEKTYLLGKTTPHGVRVGKYLLEMLIVAVAILLPALLVYQGISESESYDIFSVKAPGRSASMEFVRICVFLAALYAAYIFAVVVVKVLPGLVLSLVETGRRQISFAARRHLHYASKVEGWISMVLFVGLMAVLSAVIIYDTSFLDHIGNSLQSSPTAAASETATLVERSFVLLAVFVGLLALSQYMVAGMAYNFHRMAYAVRIHRANQKYDTLERLFQSLTRGIPSQTARRRQHYSSTVTLEEDRGMDLSSAGRSVEIADSLFDKLRTGNRDYLTEDNFRLYFDAAAVKRAFATFDPEGRGQVTRTDFQEAVYAIYEERHYIQRSLAGTREVVGRTRIVFGAVAGMLAVLFGIVLFKLQTAAFFIVLGVLYGAFTYLVQDGMRGVYESLRFIFAEHAFDVGDRVVIKGEELLVEKIELFTSIFRKQDNTAVYIPNSVLAQQTIYNLRRSKRMPEGVEGPEMLK